MEKKRIYVTPLVLGVQKSDYQGVIAQSGHEGVDYEDL